MEAVSAQKTTDDVFLTAATGPRSPVDPGEWHGSASSLSTSAKALLSPSISHQGSIRSQHAASVSNASMHASGKFFSQFASSVAPASSPPRAIAPASASYRTATSNGGRSHESTPNVVQNDHFVKVPSGDGSSGTIHRDDASSVASGRTRGTRVTRNSGVRQGGIGRMSRRTQKKVHQRMAFIYLLARGLYL